MVGTRGEDDVVMTDGANDDTSMGSNVAAGSGNRDGGCDDDEGHDFGEGEGAVAVAVSVAGRAIPCVSRASGHCNRRAKLKAQD